MKTKQTIAQQLNVTKFPFIIKDENDNKIYWEGENGFWEKTTFDDNGNLIYEGDSTGGWEKSTYDDRGNVTYKENSNGDWEKSTYDKRSNITFFIESNGFWYKQQFDENDIIVFFQNIYNKIIDNRPVEPTMDETTSKLNNNRVVTITLKNTVKCVFGNMSKRVKDLFVSVNKSINTQNPSMELQWYSKTRDKWMPSVNPMWCNNIPYRIVYIPHDSCDVYSPFYKIIDDIPCGDILGNSFKSCTSITDFDCTMCDFTNVIRVGDYPKLDRVLDNPYHIPFGKLSSSEQQLLKNTFNNKRGGDGNIQYKCPIRGEWIGYVNPFSPCWTDYVVYRVKPQED